MESVSACPLKEDAYQKSVSGTWNFGESLATLAQGSVSEVTLSMDANMHRLPEKPISRTKFLVSLADVVSHLTSTDRLTRMKKIE